MEVLHERCCGLDVHKKNVVACVLLTDRNKPGRPTKAIRTFGTMTPDLLQLLDWLQQEGVTHVAMESTGVYWKPIYNLLEGSFEAEAILLVNAQHIKAVPGRKTDVKDCEWIADLLRHGLLKGSFVPDKGQRELRELTRYRTTLVRERSAEVNRLQKTLEGANIKLASVVSEIDGKSAQAMLRALIAGEDDAKALAQLAKGRLREKIPQLEKALQGQFSTHQRFLVAQQLAHVDFLDGMIQELSQQIGERLRPFEEEIGRLCTLPGVARRTAQVILAEVGTPQVIAERFADAAHLSSWAGLCPGNHESAGKHKSGRTRKGSPWLRSALVESAKAGSRSKDTEAERRYHRIVVRRGKKKATVAVAHWLLVAAYHILVHGVTYQEPEFHQVNAQQRERQLKRALRRIEALGYAVTLEPPALAA